MPSVYVERSERGEGARKREGEKSKGGIRERGEVWYDRERYFSLCGRGVSGKKAPY